MPPKKMNYSEYVREFRENCDAELAHMLGISHQTAGKWRKKLALAHPREVMRGKLAPWLGKIPDRILAKMTGMTKNAVCLRRHREGIDSSRFVNWRDKGWIDELLGRDHDDKIADICEISVDDVRARREALDIPAFRRTFLISTRESARHKFSTPREFELINITPKMMYVFRTIDTGTTETFTVWQLRDARIKETTRSLWVL